MSGREGLKIFWPLWTIFSIIGFFLAVQAPASFAGIAVWIFNVLFSAFTMLTVWRKL